MSLYSCYNVGNLYFYCSQLKKFQVDCNILPHHYRYLSHAKLQYVLERQRLWCKLCFVNSNQSTMVSSLLPEVSSLSVFPTSYSIFSFYEIHIPSSNYCSYTALSAVIVPWSYITNRRCQINN